MLAGLGVKKGDRVGLLLPNCPQYVIAWYACQRIGAIAVGNNPLYTQRELEHQIKDAGINVMVVLENVYENFGKVRETRPGPRGGRDQADRLHEVPAEQAGAHQVPQGGEEGRQAVAADPDGGPGPVVEGRDGDAPARCHRSPRSTRAPIRRP